ncbi:Na+/H+ antiporter subunit E [Mycobacterium hubeiense]|uniref:Na+/H+ antiporter subunit E n=1 Tax=Mycobacterium hubeiense TaxID=1867256 RepID=UPI000C7E8DB8|nr:Na+/H+ antiporter subunit E [Mycobacterium sp. QGD 101]
MFPMVPLLAAFWLILSGHIEPRMLALGAGSIIVVCAMTWRAEVYQHYDLTVPFLLRLPRFFLWLGVQVLVSSLAVVRKVWSPRLALRPVVAAIPAHALPELTQVTYANAITLTPGTLSLDVSDRLIRVHGLDKADIDALRDGAMLRRLPHTGGRR